MRLTRLFLFVLFFIFLAKNSVAYGSDDTESAILRHIEGSQTEALALLKQAVNINSGSMNFEGVKQTGMLFEDAFKAIGATTRWIDGAAFGRAGHLHITMGDKGRKFLLIGHLDTVFARDSEFQNYEVINEHFHKGPGITDMKGGNVIIMQVLSALQVAGVMDDIQVKVILTGDEEKSGDPLSLAREDLIAAAKWADVVIGFEDGDSDPDTGVIARRGSIGWSLEVTGRPAHSSQIFREGYGFGAIFETARILDGFRTQLGTIENLTFNPGIIVGGTESHIADNATATAFGKSNVIAQTVKVKGDIRALTPEQVILAKSRMQAIVAENLAETSAKISFEDGYPPLAPTEGNKKLLSVFNQISQELGYPEVVAVDPRNAGAADISFTSGHADFAIDGLGLLGSGGHTIHEVADMRTFKQNMERAALLIYRVSQDSAFAPLQDGQ